MNWHERIDLAEGRGEFTDEDRKLAADWVTCACGEQDPRIRRFSGGRPQDVNLQSLGASFSVSVSRDQFAGSRWALDKIEARAKEILNELA